MAPDLDGRPGEPARSTIGRWVAQCGGCDAAGPDLAALPDSAVATVKRADYRAETDRFLRWAMIAADAGDGGAAAEATLQAAWRCDDRQADAAALRRRAAALWIGDVLRRIDILRRAGALAEAEALAAGLSGLEEEQSRIVAFQRGRIAAGDLGRHSISSALRPPARTPHVTHGAKQAPGKPGLLARLFGS